MKVSLKLVCLPLPLTLLYRYVMFFSSPANITKSLQSLVLRIDPWNDNSHFCVMNGNESLNGY